MNIHEIASSIHGATRALNRANGDLIPPWEDLTEEEKLRAEIAVERLLADPISRSHEELHNLWWELKIKDGWKYSSEYSIEMKTHPCMIPYNELPEEEEEPTDLKNVYLNGKLTNFSSFSKVRTNLDECKKAMGIW